MERWTKQRWDTSVDTVAMVDEATRRGVTRSTIALAVLVPLVQACVVKMPRDHKAHLVKTVATIVAIARGAPRPPMPPIDRDLAREIMDDVAHGEDKEDALLRIAGIVADSRSYEFRNEECPRAGARTFVCYAITALAAFLRGVKDNGAGVSRSPPSARMGPVSPLDCLVEVARATTYETVMVAGLERGGAATDGGSRPQRPSVVGRACRDRTCVPVTLAAWTRQRWETSDDGVAMIERASARGTDRNAVVLAAAPCVRLCFARSVGMLPADRRHITALAALEGVARVALPVAAIGPAVALADAQCDDYYAADTKTILGRTSATP